MKYWPPSFCFLLISASLWGDEPNNSLLIAKPSSGIDEFRAQSQLRANVLRGVTTEWQVVKRLRSSTFGSTQTDQHQKEAARIRVWMQDDQLQLDSVMTAPESLSSLTIGVERNVANVPVKSAAFTSHLYSRFESRPLVPHPRPYHLLLNKDEDRHLWDGREQMRAVGAKCPARKSATCFDIPMIARFAEGLRVAAAFHVDLTNSSKDAQETVSLLPETQEIDSVACHILEVTSRDSTQWSGRYWIESGKPHRVRRCVLNAGSQTVADFTYDGLGAAEHGEYAKHLPTQVRVLGLKNDGTVDDELVIVLKSANRKASLEGFPALTEGTVVSDFVNNKRLVVAANGLQRELSLDDLVATGAVQFDGATRMIRSFGERRLSGEWLLSWLIWPFILLPLSIVIALYVGAVKAISIVRRKRSTKTSSTTS